MRDKSVQDAEVRGGAAEGADPGADAAADAAADLRAAARTNLFMAATLQSADASTEVKIRDLSVVGAQIESSLNLPIGSEITLVRGGLSVHARVTWSNERRSGLHFTSQVSVSDWMANPTHRAQRRVDHLVAVVKAGAVPFAIPANHDTEAPGELADDLGRVARLLDNLGDALASDAALVAQHGVELQNLDIALQTLTALAETVQPGATPGAGRARLGELRRSCLEALRTNP
jgi:hypothetical protein